jgi:adenylylsulfate kinase-like enzyme
VTYSSINVKELLMVVWLTGLSGAGKTTIAEAMLCVVKPRLPSLVLIDGDVIRDLFGAGLGFDEEARKLQIGRIQRLAQFLDRQNIPVIVSALYSNPELMDWNRRNLSEYFEVYIDTPLETVIARDTKGLYSRARAGKLLHVVGLDIPWHIPESPDMVVSSAGVAPELIAQEIIKAVPHLYSAIAIKC